MDKYEISLWEDYPDLTSNNIPFLNERKICVIGSDTMTSAARAMEPKLVSNVNGTNTFSFKIYYRYKDEITGEENINPYLPYIINERKVKVLWKGKWYDLVIKKIEEDTQKRFVLCTCEDLFISELSKNGYELEFNSELQNNSGTAEELVDKVLKDSGWQPSGDQQTILQYQEESVYDVICKNNFVASQQPSNKQRTIQAGERCLIYYSCINEDYTNVQFYYAPDSNYIKEKNSMLVTGGDCYTVALCTIEIDDDKESNNFGQVIIKQGSSSQKIIFSFNINNSTNDIEKFSNEYRAKRIVKSQLTAFDKLLGRYVDVYTDGNNNEIYGYTTTEYSDPALVVNLIVNSKDFKDTQGWVGQDLKWEVYPSFTNENNQTITNYIDKAKSYLQVNTSKIYNTALVSNRQYLVPNSTDIKNGFLGGFQKGEIYIFRYKAKSSLDASEYIKASDHNTKGINCWIQNFTINNSGQYVTNGSSYLVRSALTSITQGSDNWVEITLNCTKVCTANNLDQVGLFIQATKPCYIEDIQFFKLTQGIDPGTKEIKRIDPGEFLLPAPKTIYNYYFANHSYTDGSSQIHIAEDPKDLVFLYSGDIKQGTYTPKYNNYEKITSIEVSKSNRFNILQTIAEKFECWIRFIINHNEETGQILYDENGLPQKYVQLVEQIGNDTGISFEYGIDLKGVKRTIVSNTIATKAIIVPNENEFGKNGFCTIARSPLNYCRENFILNFDYYVQQGLLNKDLLEADLYKTNEPNLGYYFWLNKYNKEYDELVDTVNMLQIRLTKQQAEYTVQFGNLRAATEKLEDNKSDLMILAGVDNFEDAKSYALAHKDNRKVQSLIGSIAKLNNTVKTLAATTNSLESSINTLESDIQTRSNTMASLIQDITDLHKNFFKKYSRFIQEGTWQDQNYVDDDKYYLDALEVAYRSSRPQIQYDISLLRLSSLEDFSSKVFDLGDICYIQDKEFFGYEEDGVTPYKQKIIISQLTSFFDTPEKDVIKVQNYATQFDDLFQRITTAAQALQFSQGRYERAAEVVKPDGTLSFGLLQDTFDYNKDLVINSANQEVTWDNTGITVSDTVNSALKVKIMAGGIFASNDGGITWKNALRGDGISTDLLTAGRINTSEIYVYDGNSPSFRWDSQGINAYTVNSTIDPNTGLASREFDFSKFVRFDKFGLYGYDGVEDFEPSTEDAIWDPLSGVKFGLTWKGFFLRGTSGGSNLEISDDDSGITFLMKNTIGNNSLEISTTNDIVLKNGNINRVQIGRLDPSSSNTQYGIWIRDSNGNNIFNVSSSGTNSIGGWTLTKDSFYHTSGNNTIGLYSSGKSATVQEHADNYYILAGNNFGVTIDGNIYANAGKIAGFTIGSKAIYNNDKSSINSANSGVYIGTDGIKLGNDFKVTKDGAVTASDLEITGGSISINYSEGSSGFYVDSDGNLHANSGTFAGNIYAKNIQYGNNYGTLPGLAISPGTINIPVGNVASPLSAGVVASLGYADNYNKVITNKATDNEIPDYFTAKFITAKNSFYSPKYSVNTGNDATEYDLVEHYHSFTEKDGKIIIGAPHGNKSEDSRSFKIADTAYFSAQVSAAREAGANTVYVRTWRFYKGSYPYNNNKNKIGVTGSVWLAGKNIDESDLELTNSRNDSDEDDYSIDVSDVWDAGWNAVTLSSDGLSQTSTPYDSHDSLENINHISFTISNVDKTKYSSTDKNLYGVFDLTLSNGNTYFMKIGMPTTNVFDAAVEKPTVTRVYPDPDKDYRASGGQYWIWARGSVKINGTAKDGDNAELEVTDIYNAGETAGKSIGHDEARANYISYVPSTPSSWNPLTATPGNIQTSGNYKYVQAQFNLTAGHQNSGSTDTSYDFSSNNKYFNIDVTSVYNAGAASVNVPYSITAQSLYIDEDTYTNGYYYNGTSSKVAVTGYVTIDGVRRDLNTFDIGVGPVYTNGRNSYTNSTKTIYSNGTYEPGDTVRWTSVTVNVTAAYNITNKSITITMFDDDYQTAYLKATGTVDQKKNLVITDSLDISDIFQNGYDYGYGTIGDDDRWWTLSLTASCKIDGVSRSWDEPVSFYTAWNKGYEAGKADASGPQPGTEGDTQQAYLNGITAGKQKLYGTNFDRAYNVALAEAQKNGYTNAYEMAERFQDGYIEGYNQATNPTYGDTEQAYNMGYAAGQARTFGSNFERAYNVALQAAQDEGYTNAYAMAEQYQKGYIAGYMGQ